VIERQLEIQLATCAVDDRDPVVLRRLDLPAEQSRIELGEPFRIIRVEHYGLEADSGGLRLSRSVRGGICVGNRCHEGHPSARP